MSGIRPADLASLYFSANLFFLTFAARNLPELSGDQIAKVLLYGQAFFALEAVGIWLATRPVALSHRGRIVFLVVVLNVIFFLFKPLHSQLSLLLESQEVATGASLGYLLIVILIAVAAFRVGRYPAARLAAAWVFSAACLVPLATLGVKVAEELAAEKRATASDLVPFEARQSAQGGARPNVYYIISDGYVGQATLRSDFAFDNSAFLQEMERRGFFNAIAARSAYTSTFLTIAGILRLDYPATDETPRFDNRTDFYPNMLRRPETLELVRRFRQLGYRIGHADNDHAECAGAEDFCLSPVDREFVGYLEEEILGQTPIGHVLRRTGLFGLYDPTAGLNSISSVRDSLDDIAGQAPFLLFVHHLPPHPPYAFRADCSLRDDFDYDFESWNPKYRPGYLENLQCVNRQILALTEDVLRQNANAIIVFQSDHGSGFRADWDRSPTSWSADAIRERTDIVNLILAPNRCREWLYPQINQINTARFALACAQGARPEYLPDRVYLSPYPGDGEDFGTVALHR